MNITIGSRKIGSGAPCFIIAEAGVNHNGDLERALRLIDIAAWAGADAVKFQTFVAERLVTSYAPKAPYQIDPAKDEESQYEMLARLELSPNAHRQLLARCRERGILFLSTPFDERSADLLHQLGVPAFKTPSGELTNLPYLEHVARFGFPMVVSTGMATMDEVHAAVVAIKGAADVPLALLHCVSNYPAAPETVNLRAIATLRTTFSVPVGYSDHTLGNDIAVAAVCLGACIIEKHFTLDRQLPGPDHRASLEPGELRALVTAIRNVEAALGDGRKKPAQSEASTAAVARKSLVAARSIAVGTQLTPADIVAKRPGTGISPALGNDLVGRRSLVQIDAGTMLTWEMLT